MVQNHVEKLPWTQYLRSTLRTKYHRVIPKYHEPNTSDQKLSSPRYTHFSFCESACVHITDLYTVNLRVYAAWSMVNLRIPFFLHSCCLPAILWSFIWESCHQGQHLCHTCIIMPTLCLGNIAWLLLYNSASFIFVQCGLMCYFARNFPAYYVFACFANVSVSSHRFCWWCFL